MQDRTDNDCDQLDFNVAYVDHLLHAPNVPTHQTQSLVLIPIPSSHSFTITICFIVKMAVILRNAEFSLIQPESLFH